MRESDRDAVGAHPCHCLVPVTAIVAGQTVRQHRGQRIDAVTELRNGCVNGAPGPGIVKKPGRDMLHQADGPTEQAQLQSRSSEESPAGPECVMTCGYYVVT